MIFSSPPGTGWPESAGNRIVPLAPRLSLIQRPPLAPFRSDVVIAVECLFAWYGVADWCAREGIPFVLGHALYMKAIHGGKAKDDDTLPTYLLCSLKSVCQSFHVDQHQREVCTLSGRVMLPKAQLLSDPLQAGLRLLPPPLPAVSSAPLARRPP
jgi:hypothetical protein